MDRYIKKKQIGEGSFGKALLVKKKEDGKEYVIKEINISKMKRKEREESKKEVSVLKKMKHPNIVSYAESFEERGNLYIVMDYCDGGDLFQAINRRRGVLFPEDEILDWFVQICLALKHIHDRKILHRDIKSQNIFLTRKGIIKMGDFGIARVLNSTMELARTCIGTPYYLSPEICENNPYNNKSDIWALGCVLYEMLTLKHAFEAGNMKNLVLKIIRGSYPPVSPRYSYEIRNLIAQLFKRNPRDRPSVNSVLKKPFIQRRIEKFLTDAEVNDEFSHTILHRNQQPGVKRGVGAPMFQKPAQLPPRPVNVAAKKPPVAKPYSNPSAKYGPSVGVKRPPSGQAVRKSLEKERKDKERKDKELEKKRRDLVEKERERRLQDKQVKVQQQQLINKQRMAHIHKAREAGWRHTLLSSSGSSNGGGGGGGFGSGGGGKPAPNGAENEEPPKKEAKYEKPALYRPAQPKEKGKYDHYNQQLDALRQDAKGAELGQGGAAMFREEREKRQEEAEAIRRQMRDRPVSASGADAAKRGVNGRQAGAEAAGRARMVNEFLSRKREAAAYKARAAVQLGWAPPGAGDAKNEPLFPYSGQDQNKPANNREEMAYLDQLKAIRMQNYQERLNIRNKEKVGKPADDPRVSADVRRKKIEALKAQADERAAKLKEQLERQRREAYEKEKRAWDNHLARKRGDKPAAPSKPLKGPAAPVVPLTAVLRDVGVDIGQPEQEMEFPAVNHAEKKQGESPAEEKQAPAAPRRQWLGGETKGSALANLPLEQTASNMEATGAADVVTRNPSVAPSVEAPGSQANRRKWGAPGSTVVNALQMAEIKAGTMTIARPAEGVGSPMGVTIVKDQPVSARDKLPVVKGPSPDATPTEVRDSVSLEVIDGRNAQDRGGAVDPSPKQGEEKKSLSQTKSAWTADQVEGNLTQTDTASRVQSSQDQKDQAPPTTSTKGSPKADAPPTSPTPSGDATPTTKATPPKSPRPSSLTKKSPTTATASSPKGQEKTEGGETRLDGKEERKEEEKEEKEVEKFLEKVPRKEEAVSPKQDKDALDVVDLEEDEEAIEEHQSAKKKMISGLSTGVFDTAPKLLRTCSDPDLRQLFRTTLALNPFFEAEQQLMTAARSVDMAAKAQEEEDEDNDDQDEDIDDGEEEEEDDDDGNEELIRQLQQLTAKNEEDDDDDDDEEEEEEEDEEDEREGSADEQVYGEDDDYQNLVESMKSLLEARDAAETPENEKRQFEDASQEDEEKTPPSSPSEAKDEAEEEEEEEEEDDSETTPLNENWDSGEGSEGEDCGMSTEERASVFSRLEESRLQLEKELGCDTFLKAYKTIQAIHEDEDDNIEEGTKHVNQILGEGKAQLYTKILQLVMADGAYTEDDK